MHIALLFSFREIIHGNGFIADVSMTGRALLEEDDGEVWIYGVNPSSMAGGGVDRATAFASFRKSWTLVLFDIAAETASFADFQRECARFLSADQAAATEEWQAAFSRVRASGVADPLLPKARPEDHPVAHSITELVVQKANPALNAVEVGVELAA